MSDDAKSKRRKTSQREVIRINLGGRRSTAALNICSKLIGRLLGR